MQENNIAVPEQPANEQNDTNKSAEDLKNYASHILTGVLVVAAIGIVAYRYFGSSATGNQDAATKLFSAKSPTDIESVISKNPSAPITPIAILKLAKLTFNEGKYDMALSKYTEFKTRFPQHEMIGVAEMGRLHCLEARSQTEEALTGFTAFATTQTNHFLYAEAVLGRARCLEQLGRAKEAIAVYDDFIVAHPKSAWTTKIEDLASALKRKMEEKKPSA